MKVLRNIFLTNLFFYSLLGIATLFVFGFLYAWVFVLAQITLWVFIALCIWELINLFARRKDVMVDRYYPEKLSNGDWNPMGITLESTFPLTMKVRVIEELPELLQKRDFHYQTKLSPYTEERIDYEVRPTKRGLYNFGSVNVFLSHLGLIERRFKKAEVQELPCYPSYIQLKKYQLLATTNRLNELGVKRIRRIGSTMEFDSIREYLRGDEYRFINWKATAKTKKLMVNQYEDERSQPIYSFIDLSRTMRMPFDGLTLLDYAINSSLVLSSITILKHDKAGLLTFSKEIETHIKADRRNHQMQLISDALYNVYTEFKETDFGKLYSYISRNINQRSLIFLYTNFETLDALHRQLPYLKLMNKSHIIVCIVFKNTELDTLTHTPAKKSYEMYNQIIGEKFVYEKSLIIQELQAHGIQTIYTTPQNLTVNTINKYLELKARGAI